ncbi:ImmA/IrrE family metallo-endopeptidase [Paenochrobactrum glaciei]|uniref:IrrE N-terminal-like domain-containing protein n=1 Tax=Paenochrobactrum glaciei TaxID=486407 RepID=A0ABN1GQ92_9HYPH
MIKRPVPANFKSRLPVGSAALDTPDRVIEYCRKHGLMNGYGAVDIQSLIEKNDNLKLVFEDLGEKDAYIKCLDDGSFVIGINKLHHKNRQVFSMAHEYGHYQLHRHNIKNIAIGEKILHRDGEINAIERQANQFAANILMPREGVERALFETHNSVIGAASLLGVSMAALTNRLNTLGIKA